MENKTPTEISYYAHEAEVVRLERHNKRAYILTLIIFIALILTNAGWIIHESLYENVVVTENTQDGEGVNIIGGGDISYGAEADSGANTP